MRYFLSESTISIIKEEKISQQALAKKIESLYNEKKVGRTISQQSISRYINGKQFPNKDIEETIVLAIKSLLGKRKFRIKMIKYQEEMQKKHEKEQKEKKERIKGIKKKSFIKVSLKELLESERYKKLIPNDEEIAVQDYQREMAEHRQIIFLWRSVPKQIQDFWMETVVIFSGYTDFIKEIQLSINWVDQRDLIDIMNMYCFMYSSYKMYDEYANNFSDEELKILGKLMWNAGTASTKLYELIEKDSDIYRLLTRAKWEWKTCSNCEKYSSFSEREQSFIKLYEQSKMDFETFMYYAALLVFLEKVDWLVIHLAFVMEKLQKNERKILFEENKVITEVQRKLIETIRAHQLENNDKA